MKFITSADWHIRATAPRYRKDKYLVAQYKKIRWILDQSISYGAEILIAGDIFDSSKSPYAITNQYLEILKGHPHKIYAVAGQHDLRFHVNDIDSTPLGTLMVANVINIKGNKDIQANSWQEKIPKEEKTILLIHKCITKGAPPFFLEDAISAESMLKTYPNYEFIVSGDYHGPHTTEIDGRWLINPGSLMRSNKDQQNHKPRVYLLDTKKRTVKPLFIPIKPVAEVFDFARIDREDKTDQAVISDFIQAIKVKTNRPNFPRILNQVVEKANPSKKVKLIINKIMGDLA